MLTMLWLSNIRLIICLFGAMVFWAMSWLYFDALFVRGEKSVVLRALGGFVLGTSYLVSALQISGIGTGNVAWLPDIILYTKMLGYIILACGVWGEPLSKRPDEIKTSAGVVLGGVSLAGSWILPIMPGFVGLGYLRRASIGLERHLKGMVKGMYILSVAEILDLRRLYLSTSDVRIYELVRDFGWMWVAQIVVMALGFLLIARWVFGYLLKRFETQITLFMGMLVLLVFAVVTVAFSSVMSTQVAKASTDQVIAGEKLVLATWQRQAEELAQKMTPLTRESTSDKEQLRRDLDETTGKTKGLTIQVLDSDSRDIITGDKVERVFEGIGYRVVGLGSSRKIFLETVIKRNDGYVLGSQELSSMQLGEVASDIGMAVRIYQDNVVIAASQVPGYPQISSPLGLQKLSPSKIDGVEYTQTMTPLKSSEGGEVAEVEIAIPTMSLWQNVGNALFYMYMTGIVVLLLMELPAVLVARYLTAQLR